MLSQNEFLRRFPNISQSCLKRNIEADTARLPAANPKPVEGNALVSVAPGKNKGGTRPAGSPDLGDGKRRRRKARITFTIFSQQPADYDAYHIKELQDVLVRVGILDGDEWDVLQGEVISEKAHTKEEVRTEIIIHYAAV